MVWTSYILQHKQYCKHPPKKRNSWYVCPCHFIWFNSCSNMFKYEKTQAFPHILQSINCTYCIFKFGLNHLTLYKYIYVKKIRVFIRNNSKRVYLCMNLIIFILFYNIQQTWLLYLNDDLMAMNRICKNEEKHAGKNIC